MGRSRSRWRSPTPGEALAEWARAAPDLRIVNLETAITTSEDWWPAKGIHYRMHPNNAPCLDVAGIDCCVLANNHVLDWHYRGLVDTLLTLEHARIKAAGASPDAARARAPAELPVPGKGRVLVFAAGCGSSGIPDEWAAGSDRPGVHRLPDLSAATLEGIAAQVQALKGPRDLAIASLHWGGNWGYRIPPAHRQFAHGLIDRAGIDLVHGHSSHHPLAMELYRDRLILYGCGDFLNDYEGIGGYEEFRGDLVLMYFPTLAIGSGTLLRLELVPLKIYRLQLKRPAAVEVEWLRARLDRECRPFGLTVRHVSATHLRLERL